MEKWRRRVRAEASGGDEAKASLAIAPPRRRFWVDKRKWFTLLRLKVESNVCVVGKFELVLQLSP